MVTACSASALEAFASQWAACTLDRFGTSCAFRFSRDREYMPPRASLAAARDMRTTAACASAWYRAWLCSSLRAVPHDARDISVGKTYLRRTIWTFAATLGDGIACRPTFDAEALARWAWVVNTQAKSSTAPLT